MSNACAALVNGSRSTGCDMNQKRSRACGPAEQLRADLRQIPVDLRSRCRHLGCSQLVGHDRHLGVVAVDIGAADRKRAVAPMGPHEAGHFGYVNPSQQVGVVGRVGLPVWSDSRHLVVNSPHRGDDRLRHRRGAVSGGRHKRTGSRKPLERLLSEPRMIGHACSSQGMQGLQHQRGDAAHEHRYVGVDPPGHRVRSEQPWIARRAVVALLREPVGAEQGAHSTSHRGADRFEGANARQLPQHVHRCHRMVLITSRVPAPVWAFQRRADTQLRASP